MEILIIICVLVFIAMLSGVRVVNQYQRGVVLTLGRFSGVREPGLCIGYKIQTFDPNTGIPIPNYDLGGQIEHARNDLYVRTFGSQLRARFSPSVNTDIETGIKYEKEAECEASVSHRKIIP